MEVMIPIVLFLSMFGFFTVLVWVSGRTKERVAAYESEFRKRLIEQMPTDVERMLAILREEEQIRNVWGIKRRREVVKIVGLVMFAVGLAMMVAFRNLPTEAMTGALVPLFAGIALLVYGFLLSPKVD